MRWCSLLYELHGGEGKSEPVRDGWVNSNLLSSLMVWAYVSMQQTNGRLIYLQNLHENCFMQLYVKIQTTQCHCITQVNPKPSGIIARDKSLTTSTGFPLGLKVVLLKMKNNNKNVSLFPLLPPFQIPSTFLKVCPNYEPNSAFAPLSRLQRRLQKTSGLGQLHFVSVNNPVSWSPGIDFLYTHYWWAKAEEFTEVRFQYLS